MKYAFIALIAIYLVIYGCSPDATEKTTDSHEQPTAVTAENHEQGDSVAVPEHQEKQAADTSAEQQQSDGTAEQVVIIETTEEPAEVAGPSPDEQVVEPQMVVMPCGREIALADIPLDAPCLNMQPVVTQESAAAGDDQQELDAAMQKMVKTTNEMVQVTRQMVVATQELLKASKEIATKVHAAEETPPAK
jgi:hypothetical protein